MNTLRFPLKLLVLLFFLNLADIALTIYGTNIGIIEGNPVFYTAPFWVHLIVKLTLPLVLAASYLPAYRFCQKHSFNRKLKFLKTLLVITVLWHAGVVSWNITILVRNL